MTLEIMIGGVAIYTESYLGEELDFTWDTKVLPFYPIYELKDIYGFNSADNFEIRFRVLAGEDDRARVLIDNVSIIDIQ